METLKYTVIKIEPQYQIYCGQLEALVAETNPSAATQEEIDLLTLLIETWDHAHATLPEADPIELLRSLMAGRQMLAKDLADVLNLGKGAVSDILNRRRGLSKEVIRRLASYFQVSQEAFNRTYKLAVAATQCAGSPSRKGQGSRIGVPDEPRLAPPQQPLPKLGALRSNPPAGFAAVEAGPARQDKPPVRAAPGASLGYSARRQGTHCRPLCIICPQD